MTEDKKVKLCAVTTIAFTINHFLLDQLVYLARNGFDVTVVCNYDEDLARNCPLELKYHPISVDRTTSIFSTLFSLIETYRFFAPNKFDLVQYATPKAALITSASTFLTRVPRRLYCQWGIRYVSEKGFKRAILRFTEKLTCMLSTHISPDSYGNLAFAVDEGLYPLGKGSVVHNGSANGINLQRFDHNRGLEIRRHVRNNLGIGDDDFVFGWVGRVTKDKGVIELVTAFLQIYQTDTSAQLIMIGPFEGKGNISDELADIIRHHPNIHYLGLQNKVEDFYSAMDVFVVPSYREGFGSVILEAQAMGVPVISTDIPGPREAMVPDKTGLMVPPRDVVALVAAMEELKSDAGKRKAMASAGIAHVTENFEQETFWGKVLEHRLSLLNKGR